MKLGAGGMPASLERVEQLTKKKISFIEADLRLVLEIFLVVHADNDNQDWFCYVAKFYLDIILGDHYDDHVSLVYHFH